MTFYDISSAAKCHYQCHKKIWLKQNPYQRHVLNCDNQRWYSERLLWLIHAHDMFATIASSVTISRLFLLWIILQNVTDIVMTNSGWNKIISASRALLRRSKASLKQLVRPSHAWWWHCVQPTRVQSLGRDIFRRWSSRWSREICIACEWFQETKRACFLALFDPTDN